MKAVVRQDVIDKVAAPERASDPPGRATPLQRTRIAKQNASHHANVLRYTIRDSECKAVHLERMQDFERRLLHIRKEFDSFCIAENIRVTKTAMKRKVSVQRKKSRKRTKSFFSWSTISKS